MSTRPEPTKKQRKRLRGLIGRIYEAELAEALEGLEADFREWRGEEILSSELNDRIHDYHQNTSRELWKLYNSRFPETWLVARGVDLGFLERSEIADDLWELIEPSLVAVRELARGRPI